MMHRHAKQDWKSAEECPICKLETENERLRQWQKEMVEKAASGGTLEGYREMGEKIARREAENERLKEEISELRKHADEHRKWVQTIWEWLISTGHHREFPPPHFDTTGKPK